jgi:hypothetical protein
MVKQLLKQMYALAVELAQEHAQYQHLAKNSKKIKGKL